MSSDKSLSYRKPVSSRPPRLPHFADKLRKIFEYFSITEGELAQRTGASQQSVSDWLLGKTCPRKPTLKAIATLLPEPIPLWWLMAGPDAGSLKDVLSKEKAQIPQPEDDDPEPTHVMCARLLERYFALAPDRKEEMTDYIRLMLKNVERQDSAARAKKRQSQAMTKNVTRDETTSNSP